MIHKKILFFFTIAILMLQVIGCVDVPTKGTDLPNYVDQVRVVNATFGLDTLLVFTKIDSLSLPTGVTDSSAYARTVIYRTNTIDFQTDAANIFIDGSSVGILGTGANTSYMKVNAGSRIVSLRINSTVIDSLIITDTVTYKKGKFSRSFGKDTVLNNVAVPFSQTIEYYSGPKSLTPDRKGTLFLHNKTTSGNYATFYIERYTFAKVLRVDSTVVKFMNAVSPDVLNLVLASNSSSNFIGNTSFGSCSGYFPLNVSNVSDSLYLKNGNSVFYSFPINAELQKNKSYTLVALRSSGGIILKKIHR